MGRDKQGDLREKCDEHHCQNRRRKKRPNSFEYRFDPNSWGSTLQHKDIEADGRCDQSDFQNDHHDHAEPDRVEFQGLDDGEDDGQGQNHNGIDFHYASQHDVGENDG